MLEHPEEELDQLVYVTIKRKTVIITPLCTPEQGEIATLGGFEVTDLLDHVSNNTCKQEWQYPAP